MPNSLLTGVSGLIAHQRLLDVVGHNIANMNTHGYKSQRILFADSLYEAISPASGGSEAGQGGTNPSQVGGGVKLSQTDRKFTQGSIEHTGESLDFAISGDGFFTVTNSLADFYTRAGAFSLDGEGFLVNPQGMYLKRFSTVGEPTGLTPGFQVAGDDRIQIPVGSAIQGVKTSEIQITGNLNGSSEPPRAQQLTAAAPFAIGGVNADGTAQLNALDTISTPFQAGDSIVIEGTTHLGSKFEIAMPVDGSTTLQQVIDTIDAAYPDATASLVNGRLDLIANETGTSQLNLSLRNSPGNVGSLSFPTHKPELIVGKGPDEEPTLVTFFDESGGEHELKIIFGKQEDDIWSLDVQIDPSEGMVLSDTIDPILFSDDGNLLSTGDPTVTLQINGISDPQTIVLDFGDAESAVRLTHYDSKSSLIPETDGSAPGVLTGVQVDSDGRVKGVASNGSIFDLAQLSIAKFRNNKGLIAEADNLYSESLNSGQPEVGSAGAGGRGIIKGGQLESANVDIALEFTKLIVAQRGFSANARTISVTDEVLEELTNIIR